MSLFRYALVAGAAYYYGRYRGRKEAEQVVQKVEEQTTSLLENPVVETVVTEGRAAVAAFPSSWAQQGYTLN